MSASAYRGPGGRTVRRGRPCRSSDRVSSRRRRRTAHAAWLTARSLEETLRLEVAAELPRWESAIGVRRYAARIKFVHVPVLTPVEIALYGVDPANDLSVAFASRPTVGLDCCFAVVDRGRLASYRWLPCDPSKAAPCRCRCRSRPTSPTCASVTHPDYRGRRLRHGVAKALRPWRRGASRVVTSINRANFGHGPAPEDRFRTAGNLSTLGTGAHRLASTPHAARRLGIQFGAVPWLTSDEVLTVARRHRDRLRAAERLVPVREAAKSRARTRTRREAVLDTNPEDTTEAVRRWVSRDRRTGLASRPRLVHHPPRGPAVRRVEEP